MVRVASARRTSLTGLVFVFCSCLAGLYVAGRLWTTTRQLYYLEQELAIFQDNRLQLNSQLANRSGPQLPAAAGVSGAALFYSIRAEAGVNGPLQGRALADSPPTVGAGDEALLGQLEWVEAGVVSGWACVRGAPNQVLKMLVYVDGVLVGATTTGEPTPHLLINRLCEGQTSESDAAASRALGFRMELPPLQHGRHEVRAFMLSLNGASKQEVNQSPLAFVETPIQANVEQALARKDAIIRVRNAQVAMLWDELHTRQPWRAATASGELLSFESEAKNSSSLLLVIAINTGMTARRRRDNLRQTWVPTGDALRALERDLGVVIRFIIGRTEQSDDPAERAVQAEASKFGDILRLDSTDTYADLSSKTLKLFGKLPGKFRADYYFKVDDDVIVNVPALVAYLEPRRQQGNLYMGCMKSGPVLTEKRYKWFEPDAWRFGDAQSEGGSANYMRHASGQFYGVSAPVAKYIARSASVLYKYANEDITVGSWMVGLDVEYVDERRMCCASPDECATRRENKLECLGFFEMSCAGICHSEERLVGLYQDCVLNLGTPGAAGTLLQSAATMNNRMNKFIGRAASRSR